MILSKKQIPNLLTIFRGLAALAIIALFFVPTGWNFWAAYILFVLAAITDYLDGWLARKWNAVSDFGVVFDPLFDKILVLSLLLLIYPLRIVPPIIIILLFLRDISTDVMKNYLLARGKPTPAVKTAKIKTACQMGMLHFVLLALALPQTPYLQAIAIALGAIAVIFSLASGTAYTRRLIAFFRQPAE